jgi:hypothetical protein
MYPGYLRYFDSTIQELLERGHAVEVWFDGENKQVEGLRALDDLPDVQVGGRLPRREGRIRSRTRLIRSLADYSRYLDPRFAEASYLRERAARKLPLLLTPLARLGTLPRCVVAVLARLLLDVEHALPRSRELEEFFARRRFDVVVAAPNIYFSSSGQGDRLASAKALGIPTVAAIASWDNLTTKGLVRGDPDAVVVWNEAQLREAVELHGIPPERIVITGAYPFDKWFARSPSRTSQEFKREVGLPDDAPYVLFVGSTASIRAPDAEQRFVCEWLQALRGAPDQRLREVSVLVRPHPYNSEHWSEGDLTRFGPAAVWPNVGRWPLSDSERDDYFDSLFHAAAVVGVNTSAMIEAAILGRPVLTVTLSDFAETQTGTLHFKHLLRDNGGFVREAASLDDHLAQLSSALRSGGAPECASFTSSFIRPLGVGRSATPIFADAIERTFQAGSRGPQRAPIWARIALVFFGLFDEVDHALEQLRRARRRLGRPLNRYKRASRRRRKQYARVWRQGRRRAYQTLGRRAPRPIRHAARHLVMRTSRRRSFSSRTS